MVAEREYARVRTLTAANNLIRGCEGVGKVNTVLWFLEATVFCCVFLHREVGDGNVCKTGVACIRMMVPQVPDGLKILVARMDLFPRNGLSRLRCPTRLVLFQHVLKKLSGLPLTGIDHRTHMICSSCADKASAPGRGRHKVGLSGPAAASAWSTAVHHGDACACAHSRRGYLTIFTRRKHCCGAHEHRSDRGRREWKGSVLCDQHPGIHTQYFSLNSMHVARSLTRQVSHTTLTPPSQIPTSGNL